MTIQKQLDLHKQWLLTDGEQGERLDLREANLTGVTGLE